MNTLNTIITILLAYYFLMSFMLLFFGGYLIKSRETLHKYFIPFGMFYVWIKNLFLLNVGIKQKQHDHFVSLKLNYN